MKAKPVLGLLPRHIHEQNRIWDIMKAIERSKDGFKAIPPEWTEELNLLFEQNSVDKEEIKKVYSALAIKLKDVPGLEVRQGYSAFAAKEFLDHLIEMERLKKSQATLNKKLNGHYIRGEIRELASAMEERLREREPGSAEAWKGKTLPDLWGKIPWQVEKLRALIELTRIIASDQDRRLIRKKCADIANYCMFIHDNVGK